MKTETLVGERIARVPALALSGKFKKYTPENEKIVRELDVKPDIIRHINIAWKEFMKIARNYATPAFTSEIYHAAIQEIRGIPRANRTAKAVEVFSISTASFNCPEDRIGLFLSALVNLSPDEDFVLHINALESPPKFLGYRNTKNVKIHGSVGDCFCEEMQCGNIIVNGSAGDYLGREMIGDSVLIKGNVGVQAADHLVGGEITVEGDAAFDAGIGMVGGVLRVMGKIESISDDAGGGKIYAGRKPVFNKPSVCVEGYLQEKASNEEENELFRAMYRDDDG